MSHQELQGQSCEWLETADLCRSLAVSRSTLGRWRRREVLRQGQHWVRKNPAAPRSDLLWNCERCSALLRGRRRPCRGTAEASPALDQETRADYVLLHRDTGMALYSTCATEAEIQRANTNLRRSGNRNRYVAARHLPHPHVTKQG
jgi:hypothetical protein